LFLKKTRKRAARVFCVRKKTEITTLKLTTNVEINQQTNNKNIPPKRKEKEKNEYHNTMFS
jgi:hypothetical protein